MIFRVEDNNDCYYFFETDSWYLGVFSKLDMPAIFFKNPTIAEVKEIVIDSSASDIIGVARNDIISVEYKEERDGVIVYSLNDSWWSHKYSKHKQNDIDNFVEMHYNLPMGILDDANEVEELLSSVKQLLKDWENRE